MAPGPEAVVLSPVHCRRTAGQIAQQESQPLATRTAQTDEKQAHAFGNWHLVRPSVHRGAPGGHYQSCRRTVCLMRRDIHQLLPAQPEWGMNAIHFLLYAFAQFPVTTSVHKHHYMLRTYMGTTDWVTGVIMPALLGNIARRGALDAHCLGSL